MDKKTLITIIYFGIGLFSCKQATEKNHTVDLNPQQELIFPKGGKVANNNFIGDVWVNMQVLADSVNKNSVGTVTFDPGARSNWHSHPNGQIIMALEGEGYYQEKGLPKRILRKGDVVKCPANTPHWHGASAEKPFIQIAITSRVDGPTEWLDPVTEDEHLNGN